MNERGSGRLVVLLLGSLGTVGCATDSQAPPTGATVRDSAGVRIVENHDGSRTADGPWRAAPEAEVEIGPGALGGDRILFEVKGVVRLSDGRLVVANGGSAELLWFDSLGAFLRSTGRRGEGPGEFKSIVRLHRCAADTLLVSEWLRVSQFDPQGRFVDSRRLVLGTEDEGGISLHGPAEDCSAVLVAGSPTSPPPLKRIHAVPATLFWWNPTTDARDTVASVVRHHVFGMERDGRTLPFVVPWSERTHWTVVGDRLYLGSTHRAEFRAFDRRGRLRSILRYRTGPRPVTEADRRTYRERREELIAANPSFRESFRVPRLSDFPLSDERPAHSGLLGDDQDRLWVRGHPRSLGGWPYLVTWDRTAEPEVWTVFDADGRWVGSLEMPPGFELMSARHARALGILRDALDRESVRVYRIVPRGSGKESSRSRVRDLMP